MTSVQFREALGLTVGGMGTAFLVLALLILLIVAVQWMVALPFVQRTTGAVAAAQARAARRNKALVAAIAVSTALAEGETTAQHDAQEGTAR